jgi:RNA polymerase sigma-70 factor (ECF subfamily)
LERPEFEKLALEHLDAVYRLALQLTRRPDEASDLVQETYLRAFRASERFETRGGGIRPWLFRILRNAFYTQVSKAKRRPGVSDNLHEEASSGPEPGEALPAWDLAALDWEQVDHRLKSAVERLNPEYREVLLLWGVEGMKYREIALIIDVPIGTVMSRLYRARTALINQLGSMAEDLGVRMTGSSMPKKEDENS